MKIILTPQEMKAADMYAIKGLHIPSLRLMERAGKAVVHEIIARTSRNGNGLPNVLVLCGKGNNGGDGFVVARLLVERGYPVTVVLIERSTELMGDAKMQYMRLNNGVNEYLKILSFEKFQTLKKKKNDVIVDAMLGTSFRGELKGKYKLAAAWCNKQRSVKIAVDIPTGLNGETGETGRSTFRADSTVTMSNPKTGFFLDRAKKFTGKVIIAPIGIPAKAIPKSQLYLVEESDVRSTFPLRAVNSHKHSVGKVFVLAGSRSMMGAAFLCSQASMRSGAGQVILGIPESEYLTIAKRTVEVMPLGLPSTSSGSISSKAMDEITQRLSWCDVLLIGCGMSRNAETQQVIRDVIRSANKPMVIDADGLNALIGNLELLRQKKTAVVLTPHHGEFSRLTGIPSAEIAREPFRLASEFAKRYHVTLVLKGAPSVTAGPDGKVFVNPTGNPGMSTAGSGDVLAGVIASMLGQHRSTVTAAINGVYIHGKAGDHASKEIGMHGMIAGDIVERIPAAIKETVKQ